VNDQRDSRIGGLRNSFSYETYCAVIKLNVGVTTRNASGFHVESSRAGMAYK